MPHVAVVYATRSRVPRSVIVSDTERELAAAIAPFERHDLLSVVRVPAEECTDAAALRAAVAARIGEPVQSDRVVEIDERGEVVAVWSGDPEIDRPTKDPRNRLELHGSAIVGDVKEGDGFRERARPADGPDLSTVPGSVGYIGARG